MRRWLFLGLVVLSGCATTTPQYHYGSSCHSCCRRSLLDVAIGGLVSAVFDELTREPTRPQPMPALLVRNAHPGRVSTRVLFAGGHLQLIGMPARSQDEVVLAFRPVAALDHECDVQLYRDARSLTVGERLRHTEHELLATLRIEELGASAQLTGTVCGHSFDLDAAARDSITDFVARFHRRVNELSASASTSVANAR